MGALAVNRTGVIYYPDRSADLLLLSGESEVERLSAKLQRRRLDGLLSVMYDDDFIPGQ